MNNTLKQKLNKLGQIIIKHRLQKRPLKNWEYSFINDDRVYKVLFNVCSKTTIFKVSKLNNGLTKSWRVVSSDSDSDILTIGKHQEEIILNVKKD